MEYSTVTVEIEMPLFGDGSVFEVGSLCEFLLKLRDTRKARGKRYKLALVLVLVVLAKMCGEDHPYGIAEWAQERAEVLCTLFGVRYRRLPSHNTYRRVLRKAVDVEELQNEVRHFLMQKPGSGQSVLIALDGKTLRGSIPAGRTQGLHLLAAYLPGEGIVLVQVAVECKENEISAAPRVLAALDLRGKIVRGDALLTQRDLSVQIVESGGEYVWIVKQNQPQLHQDIEQLFQPEVCTAGFSPSQKDFQTTQRVGRAHGRLEERTLTTSSLLRDYADWPYVEQVFKLERRVTHLKTGVISQKAVYGVTSLRADEAGPERLLALVRDYWAIENGLHYRRDRTLREDATRMTSQTLAQAMAILNNLVVALAFRHGWHNLPQARRHYDAHPQDALRLVLCRPS